MEGIYGIDFGNKLAGTTVVATLEGGKSLRLDSSLKKKDADRFLMDYFSEKPAGIIYLDAPLSLPGGIYNPKPKADFFYRDADRQLGAMSPMFLGGLTARAIRIKSMLEEMGQHVFETYPGALARKWALAEAGYKKGSLTAAISKLQQFVAFSLREEEIPDWHHLDSVLALASGLRHQSGEADRYGQEGEGFILV